MEVKNRRRKETRKGTRVRRASMHELAKETHLRGGMSSQNSGVRLVGRRG